MHKHQDRSTAPGKGVLTRGYIQVYTGNGKGKTTAAIGLAVRAAGAGLKVYIAQFMKNGQSSEIRYLERFSDHIRIEQFIRHGGDPSAGKGRAVPDSLNWSSRILEVFSSRRYEIVILEEVSMAVMCRLVPVEDLLKIIAVKPASVELVITGRYAHPDVIEKADLVTDMRAVKHYFYSGVEARMGIEK
jgi:cob(I)alamin adenosyltransferase